MNRTTVTLTTRTDSRKRQLHVARPQLRPMAAARRGSVLIVVLALLSALMLLGFMFYTIASQERENARYFAASEKFYSASLSPDELMDFALEQLIVGPQESYVNSALWGGRYSLLPTLVGPNMTPFDGPGINLIDGGGTLHPPQVDQNYDGTADTVVDADGNGAHDLLQLDLAQWMAATGSTNIGAFPQPDVGYSYPDINSVFLAYSGVEPVTGRRVVIPSFHRPQYLRGLFGTASTASVVQPTDWYTDAVTAPFVLRPHSTRPLRAYNPTTGIVSNVQMGSTDVTRFHAEFFSDSTISGSAKNRAPNDLKEGFFDQDGPTGTFTAADFDVDADGDPANGAEAVWLDLNYPVDETPDGTSTFIPLFAMTVYDLDGLLNLNAHGNAYGIAGLGNNPFGSNASLSRSNEGRSRHEVNPQWGFDAPASIAASSPAYQQFFGHDPTDTQELANMDYWFTLVGNVEMVSSTLQPNAGRWGESSKLTGSLLSPRDFPQPGVSGSDVEPTGADALRGLVFRDLDRMLFPPAVVFPQPVHPEDVHGRGTSVGNDGKTPRLVQLATATITTNLQMPAYVDYWVPNATSAFLNYTPRWARWQIASTFANALVEWVLPANIGTQYTDGRYIDDPGEMLLDFELARDQSSDAIFGPDETANLHLTEGDRVSNSITSRLINHLVPANFDAAGSTNSTEQTNAALRRKRFTTMSTDLKNYTMSSGRMRTGETNSGLFPNDPASNIFRNEVRAMLQGSNNPMRYKGLLRKLSVNHVAAGYYSPADGETRYLLRPLTPHPTSGLTNVDILTTLAGAVPTRFGLSDTDTAMLSQGVITTGIDTPAKQEWWARRDRQNLARDIYTLLYALGHPTNGNALQTDNSLFAVYSRAQLREMAQFAVNMVDAMDPDDNVTVFIYDTNLANGYTANDNGYANPVSGTDSDPAVDEDGDGVIDNDFLDVLSLDGPRGTVYGVESQQLALSEALVVLAKKFTESGTDKDHKATVWDDEEHRDFTFVELQNLTPNTLNNFNGSWSIVIEPTYSTGALSTTGTKRAMTIVDPTQSIPAGSVLTVSTAGDGASQGRGNDPNALFPSPPTWPPSGMEKHETQFRVDPAGSQSAASVATLDAFTRIAPKVETRDFNLIWQDDSAPTTFRINDIGSSLAADGAPVINDGTSDPALTNGPKGGAWLDLGSQSARDNVLSGTVTFSLRRRANLHRPVPAQNNTAIDNTYQQDNPWIVVDRMSVPLRVLDLTGANTAAMQTKLANDLQASQRVELLRDADTAVNADLTGYQSNTLGLAYDNDNDPSTSPPPMALWQRHYDRSFASPADLLTVPLYGPRNLTRNLPNSNAVQDPRQVAAVNFLFPDRDVRPVLPVSPAPQTDVAQVWPSGNLWYRIFEFVELPSKYGTNDGIPWFAHYGGLRQWLGDPTASSRRLQERPPTREFGRINLNMVRHPHVLGGLLDDTRVIGLANNVFGGDKGLISPHPTSVPTGTNNETWGVDFNNSGSRDRRDWYLAMMLSRDGFDPVLFNPAALPAARGPILPGLPSSKPFRDFGSFPTGSPSLRTQFDSTLFRVMPGDNVNGNGRRTLFELGNEDTSTPKLGPAMSDANFETRYRLLGKVLNHSTTRTNSFLVFMQVNLFEAKGLDHDSDPSTPNVFQIGKKLSDPEGYRGVFMIDRSKALEMLQSRDLPNGATYSLARKIGSDGRPTPVFDWRQLIEYRKVISAN